MKRIGIIGTGSYVPEKVLSNHDIEKFLDTSDEWIYTRTGVRERRIADRGTATSDLAKIACERAMDTAGVKSDDIDLIVLATITPDTHCPAGANWLEAKLGCENAVSFDITAACSGFIFALHVADKLIRADANRTALVCAGEIMTRTVNWEERESCILWGDGAGAVVLTETAPGHEVLSTHIHTDGANGDTLLMPGGGSLTTPISHESVDKKLHFLKMIEANKSFKSRGEQVRRGGGGGSRLERLYHGRYRRNHPPSGKYQDHPGRGEEAQGADGQGLYDHRAVREHLFRDRPHRARRGGEGRDRQGGQARGPHGLRRRTDLGEQPHQVVGRADLNPVAKAPGMLQSTGTGARMDKTEGWLSGRKRRS